MYTLIVNTGQVYRDSDLKQIAPTQSTDDVDYQSYVSWVSANTPTEVYSLGDDYEYIGNGQFQLTLASAIAQKLQEVSDAFDYQFQYGTLSSSLGFVVDNRRSGDKNDKDNVQSLIDLGVSPVMFKDHDGNFHQVTTQDLITLKNEMNVDGLGKYQKKWTMEATINACTTTQDVLNVVVSF